MLFSSTICASVAVVRYTPSLMKFLWLSFLLSFEGVQAQKACVPGLWNYAKNFHNGGHLYFRHNSDGQYYTTISDVNRGGTLFSGLATETGVLCVVALGPESCFSSADWKNGLCTRMGWNGETKAYWNGNYIWWHPGGGTLYGLAWSTYRTGSCVTASSNDLSTFDYFGHIGYRESWTGNYYDRNSFKRASGDNTVTQFFTASYNSEYYYNMFYATLTYSGPFYWCKPPTHSHTPHTHYPHAHRPHAHRPHNHQPHNHQPHTHSPAASHTHAPHVHRPHTHYPHTHSPTAPHTHTPSSPHTHTPQGGNSSKYGDDATSYSSYDGGAQAANLEVDDNGGDSWLSSFLGVEEPTVIYIGIGVVMLVVGVGAGLCCKKCKGGAGSNAGPTLARYPAGTADPSASVTSTSTSAATTSEVEIEIK